MHNLVDASPLVRVLGLSSDDTEAFQDVDDIIDTSSFNLELFRALVKQQKVLLRLSIDA